MATHVATCHGGRVENEVPESQVDSLPCEEDGDADDVMLDEERSEGVRKRKRAATGGKEGKQLQCSHCQMTAGSIAELRTHVKVRELNYLQTKPILAILRLCMRNRRPTNALSATSKSLESTISSGTSRFFKRKQLYPLNLSVFSRQCTRRKSSGNVKTVTTKQIIRY